MAEKFQLTEEALGYVTADDQTNTDTRFLVAGSQNVMIDRQKKTRIRPGYSRLGVANAALTPIKQHAPTWHPSKGDDRPMRFYDVNMETYLETVDGTAINAWTLVSSAFTAANIQRTANWFDTDENEDLLIVVEGTDKMREWNGAVAVVASIPDGTHVTKAGTDTWGGARFYTTRDMTMVCVRTGIEYTYSAGMNGLTLTVGDSTGLVAGDILVQKLVTISSTPVANRENDTIFVFENQIVLGSDADELVYFSRNSDYDDFTFSTPRAPGEGGLLTLTDPAHAFAALGADLVMFCGRSDAFKALYTQSTINNAVAETLTAKKLDTGVDQAAQTQEVILPVGNGILYLTYEPALRFMQNPDNVSGLDPKAYSNPIKPDFDAEDWTGACMNKWKNAVFLSSRVNSKLYILEFVEDANGRTRRFWQPPQIGPFGALSIIDEWIHAHSNVVPETYKILDNDSFSDISSSDDKLPINAIARFAFNNFGRRDVLKNHDEYMNEGEITPSTDDLLLDLHYEYGGTIQTVEKVIDGSNEDILLGTVAIASLGQNNLAQNTLGGVLTAPPNARKFRAVFEMPKEDYHELQAEFSTNEVDRYWAILSHGPNAKLSARRATNIKL